MSHYNHNQPYYGGNGYRVVPPVYGIPDDTVDNHNYFVTAPQVWHLPPSVWKDIWDNVTGRTIKIAVLDTGMNDHSDLPTPLLKKSYISGESASDGNGHGTHVSGTALGRNGIGVAPGASLMIYKVLSNRGSGGSDGIARAIRDAANDGADIISMSLGGGSPYQPTEDAIKYAWSIGVLVNAAAGNSGYNGSNTIGYPAKFDSCICTGATRSDGTIANFSSGGSQIDWAMPGENIISTSNGGGYISFSGTSMATPFASGVLALIVELMRREGSKQWKATEAFRNFIQAYVEDRGTPGKDPRYGYGVPKYTDIVHSLKRGDLKWI